MYGVKLIIVISIIIITMITSIVYVYIKDTARTSGVGSLAWWTVVNTLVLGWQTLSLTYASSVIDSLPLCG